MKTPFHSSTGVSHASDLTQIFDEVPLAQKPVISLLVDGGPDLNPAHTVNFLTYGRLWRDQQLDCLIIATHAPGQSAYNYIEHAWSVLSRSLTGVTVPNHLPDELPPCEQHLPEEDRRRKESVVFDQAIDILCGHWHHRTYDDREIVPKKVNCLDPLQKYNDHELLHQFSKASMKQISENVDLSEVRDLLVFLCRHAVRSTYLTLFLKCKSDTCDHCRRNLVRASGAVELLRSSGGRLFSPTPSIYLESHYLTFSECCFQLELGKAPNPIDCCLLSKTPDLCKFGCFLF